jgi:hypothetical protein
LSLLVRCWKERRLFAVFAKNGPLSFFLNRPRPVRCPFQFEREMMLIFDTFFGLCAI